MDYSKLSLYIIILGTLILGYGGWQYVDNQDVKFSTSNSKKGIFGGRNDIGNWMNVQSQNVRRKYERESATKVMIAGGIVFLIGWGFSASVKKDDSSYSQGEDEKNKQV